MINNFDKAAYKAAQAEETELIERSEALLKRGRDKDLIEGLFLALRANLVIINSRLRVIENHLDISTTELPPEVL